MTLPNKVKDIQHLVLALRQRGMEHMDMGRNEDGSFWITMAYYGPHTPLKHATLQGLTDVAVLENARDFLVEHGLPV